MQKRKFVKIAIIKHIPITALLQTRILKISKNA